MYSCADAQAYATCAMFLPRSFAVFSMRLLISMLAGDSVSTKRFMTASLEARVVDSWPMGRARTGAAKAMGQCDILLTFIMEVPDLQPRAIGLRTGREGGPT